MLNHAANSFFEREYPLVRLFELGDDHVIYDAKSHFAFILSEEELAFHHKKHACQYWVAKVLEILQDPIQQSLQRYLQELSLQERYLFLQHYAQVILQRRIRSSTGRPEYELGEI